MSSSQALHGPRWWLMDKKLQIEAFNLYFGSIKLFRWKQNDFKRDFFIFSALQNSRQTEFHRIYMKSINQRLYCFTLIKYIYEHFSFVSIHLSRAYLGGNIGTRQFVLITSEFHHQYQYHHKYHQCSYQHQIPILKVIEIMETFA